MKTLQTLATLLLAAFLVLAPTVAFAAGTSLTVAPSQSSYSGTANVTLSGTVTPAPSSPNTAVVLTTKNPQGAVVDIGQAPVSTTTGGYSYTLVAGASSWTNGAYSVSAVWGAAGVNATSSTTFSYTGTIGTGPSATTGINVQVQASSPVWPGQTEYVGILTSFPGNGSLVDVTFKTVHYHPPTGPLVTLCSAASQTGCVGSFERIHVGFYQINFTLPATALAGGYFVHAWVNNTKVKGIDIEGQGLGSFTVNPAIATAAGQTALQTAVTGLASGVSSLTTTMASAQQSLTSLGDLTTTLNNLQSSVNTISSGVNSITNSLSSLTNTLNGLSNISGQVSSINSAISNNQTYVLVVAALAAITLVLELAILVRKLS
jgi:hypothetical protein